MKTLLLSLGTAAVAALLAGCAGQSTLAPLPVNLGAADSLGGPRLNEPDISPPPKCKGQKITKDYAEVAKEVLKKKGGSLCVPAFDGWGGALQYPQTFGSYTYAAKAISSTTAYKGGNFPAPGSKKPLFYLQLGFNSFPGFYSTLPKGPPLVSSHLTPKKSYTIELWEYYYALGWSEEVSCYQVAGKSKNGGALAAVGSIFENLTLLEHNIVIEVLEGALVANKC